MEIEAGTSAYISRDIVIENQHAFKEGEQVIVETITPNSQRPQYKYVVFSSFLNKRFQLCDTDLTVMQKPVQQAALHQGNAQQQQQTEPLTKRCPYCKETILADAIKCKHCGSDLASSQYVQPTSGPGVTPAKKAILKKCPKCGAQIPSMASRCQYCKTTLSKQVRGVGGHSSQAGDQKHSIVPYIVVYVILLIIGGMFIASTWKSSSNQNEQSVRVGQESQRELEMSPSEREREMPWVSEETLKQLAQEGEAGGTSNPGGAIFAIIIGVFIAAGIATFLIWLIQRARDRSAPSREHVEKTARQFK